MSDDRYTFAHFMEPEALADRMRELQGTGYSEEQVAAVAFYFGLLGLMIGTRFADLYGDIHVWLHQFTNIFSGEWLSEVIVSGSVDPRRLYEYVASEHGVLLLDESHDEQEHHTSEDVKPMDSDTFNNIWGGFEQ